MTKKPKKYSKFRTKVLRILLFTGIVPLLIIAVVSLVTVVKTRLENISELQTQALSATSEKIERYLDQKINVLNLVVDLNPENVSGIDVERLEFIASEIKEAAGNVNELSFIDKYGQEVVRVTDAQPKEPAAFRDFSQKQGFQVVIVGQNYFGPINYSPAGMVMAMASQIENKSRQVIGVIWAEVDLAPIVKEVSEVKIGKEGFVYLVDQAGNLIVSSNKDLGLTGQNLVHLSLVKDVIDGRVHNGLSAGDRYTNHLGQKVIFSGRPLGAINWFIMSEWPWQDAFSVVGVMIGRFLGIILASLVLIIFFSLIFARLVVKPVETLSQGADEITKGNLDYRIQIQTGDELEKLGERFNNMIVVLKENEELRDEFVFIAAHQLRAPVSVIRGYLSMILAGEFGSLNKETREALNTSRQLNERLVKLVEDLLEVARGEAGKMQIEVESTSIQENVMAIIKEFKEQAAKKGVELVYHKPEADIKVLADPYKLKEVLSNLVDNAIQYTLGKEMVIVSHQVKDRSLVIHVKDQGIGISEKDIKKLFTKFFRAETKQTQDIAGTGLGLFICKQIIERMGGRIWVESELGKGSTFSFSLPLALRG